MKRIALGIALIAVLAVGGAWYYFSLEPTFESARDRFGPAYQAKREQFKKIAGLLPPKGSVRGNTPAKNLTPIPGHDLKQGIINTEIVMYEQLLDPDVKLRENDEVDLLLHALDETRQVVLDPLLADLHVAPVVGRDLCQHVGGDLDALVEQDLARVVREARRRDLPLEQPQHLLAGALADDADLVLLILGEAGDLFLLDQPAAIVLGHALAREDPRVDRGALDAGRDAQRSVAHLARLLAEDRAQELLFR